MSSRLHRFLLHAAILAALLHALSATIGYLKASADGVRVVEVCTSFGVERIHVDAAGNTVDAPPHSHAPHCDYCAAGQMAGLHRSRLVFEGGCALHASGGWYLHPRRYPEPRSPAHGPRAPPAILQKT